jgi:hypothetical protein
MLVRFIFTVKIVRFYKHKNYNKKFKFNFFKFYDFFNYILL